MREIRWMNKRGVALLACIVAAATMLGGVAALAADPVCGDVNKSSTVSTADALLVLRKAVGVSVALQCAPPSLAMQTGQTTCYNTAGASISCSGTGQDGNLLKGIARSFTDNGDGTVTDNKTGLMWEKLSDDGTVHDKDTTYTWTNAFAVKIAALNSASFAGHNDWRLPNLFEIESLVNVGASDPAVYPAMNSGCVASCTVLTCSCTLSDFYWTSSTYKYDPTYAWYMDFFDGSPIGYLKTDLYAVRAVRAGS